MRFVCIYLIGRAERYYLRVFHFQLCSITPPIFLSFVQTTLVILGLRPGLKTTSFVLTDLVFGN